MQILAGSSARLADGRIVIQSSESRSLQHNRILALEKLAALISKASKAPRKRKKTRPTHSSVLKRLSDKKNRSEVKKGMVLAQIDDVLYAAELRQRKAEKLQAEASIVTANAKIKQAEAKLQLAKLNWTRAQELYSKRAMAKSDYDTAESAYISALADRAAANASLKQAEAQLAITDAENAIALENDDALYSALVRLSHELSSLSDDIMRPAL